MVQETQGTALPLHGSQHRQLVQQNVVEVLSDPENVVFSHGVEVVPLPTLLLAHEVVHGEPDLLFVSRVEGGVWFEATIRLFVWRGEGKFTVDASPPFTDPHVRNDAGHGRFGRSTSRNG